MKRCLAALVLLFAPLAAPSAFACSPPYPVAPPPPPPMPPAPLERVAGESDAALAARGAPLLAAHRQAQAEWEAEYIVKPRVEKERAEAQAKVGWIKVQDDLWNGAETVMLAKIRDFGFKEDTRIVIYRPFQRLKGTRRLSTIRYPAPRPPCDGENPGLRGGKDGTYLLFVGRGWPHKDVLRVLPLREIDSPLLLAALKDASPD